MFKDVKKGNINDYFDLKISDGDIWHFKIFNPEESKWLDYDQAENGKEIADLLFELFGASIFHKDKFNVINNRICFSNKSVSCFTEKQTILQNNLFLPLSKIKDLRTLKKELNNIPFVN